MITKLKKIALAQTRALPGRFIRPRVVFLTSDGVAANSDDSGPVAKYAQALFANLDSSHPKESQPSNRQKLTAVIDEQMGFGAVFVWRSFMQLEREALLHPRVFLSERPRPDACAAFWAGRPAHPLDPIFTKEYAQMAQWFCVHEQPLEEVRRQLYDLELRGPNRHIVHSLRITAASHLPKKRAVAEAWCRLIAKLAASRAALPNFFANSSIQGSDILDSSNDTVWQRRAREAILSCYDLQDWIWGKKESTPLWQTVTGEPAFTVKSAARLLASLGSVRMLLRKSPRVLLRGLPRLATAVAVVSVAVDATKEHNALRDFGAALIARAEAEWMRRLALQNEQTRRT